MALSARRVWREQRARLSPKNSPRLQCASGCKRQTRQTAMTSLPCSKASPVVGAYKFTVTPGPPTTMDVNHRIGSSAKTYRQLGIAPADLYVSVSGLNDQGSFDDYRARFHD